MTYIVALTAFTNAKTEDQCLKAGMKRVINKPLTFQVLTNIMWRYYFLDQPENNEDQVEVNEESEEEKREENFVQPNGRPGN